MLKNVLPLLALFALPVFAKPVLTVYTYDSFSADWGPGPAVKKAFGSRLQLRAEIRGTGRWCLSA